MISYSTLLIYTDRSVSICPCLISRSRVIRSKVITGIANQPEPLVCFAASGAWQRRSESMKRIPALILRSSFSHGVPLTIHSQFVASIRGRRFYARVLGRSRYRSYDSLLTGKKQSCLGLSVVAAHVHRYIYIDIYTPAVAVASRFKSGQKNRGDPFDCRAARLTVEFSRPFRIRRKLSRYLKVIGVARTLLRDEYVS